MQNKNELAYNTFLLRFFFDSRSERCLHFKKWAFAFCIPRSLFVFLFVLYYVQAHRYQNHDSASQLRMDSAETTVDVRPKGHHLASSSWSLLRIENTEHCHRDLQRCVARFLYVKLDSPRWRSHQPLWHEERDKQPEYATSCEIDKRTFSS